ncbi:hypothetical protein [Siminovitchia fortis]|uniref:hypothetical protein n=1 Tax=Siminovitchia fortis TaxID=254758 RepID=UPI001FD063C8|nr:hypothetical protein [Siminovitchia fortis]
MGKPGKMPYVLLGVGVAGALLSTKENRGKAMDMFEKIKEKVSNLWGGRKKPELLEKAGRPDPHDHEDAKMVGEGAQYSVEYYNKEVQQP